MKIKDPEKRLYQFWGKVDKKHITIISKWVIGNSILDVGSGFGTTSGEISKLKDKKPIGIDYDQTSIETAKRLYPNGTYLFQNCESLSFPDSHFDTIILRDVLHHLKGESDFTKSISELIRVIKPNGRILIFDPNINFILKTARNISAHKDEECTYEEALQILQGMNCKIIHKEFNTVYSLPLSGGYVGLSLVPNINFVHTALLSAERVTEKIINSLKIGRYLCWRYLIVSEVIK